MDDNRSNHSRDSSYMSVASNGGMSASNKSSLDISLQRHTSRLFDATNIEHFRKKIQKTTSAINSSPSNSEEQDSGSNQTSEMTTSVISTGEMSVKLLKLTKDDFPDVCVGCEQCVKSIKNAMEVRALNQIRDADIANKFVESAMIELLKFLQRREEICQGDEDHEHADGGAHHEHHTHTDHHKLEESMEKKMEGTRKAMLEGQQAQRKFKFNQPEYRINRKVMVEKVSKLIHMRIKQFMESILADDTHCTDNTHKHQDVKENSMIFKELNFGQKQWNVEIPTSGFVNFIPFFSYATHEIKQNYADLDTVPRPKEIESFISKIM